MQTEYFLLLELQRVLRHKEYNRLELSYLNSLRDEIDNMIKKVQDKDKNV